MIPIRWLILRSWRVDLDGAGCMSLGWGEGRHRFQNGNGLKMRKGSCRVLNFFWEEGCALWWEHQEVRQENCKHLCDEAASFSLWCWPLPYCLLMRREVRIKTWYPHIWGCLCLWCTCQPGWGWAAGVCGHVCAGETLVTVGDNWMWGLFYLFACCGP